MDAGLLNLRGRDIAQRLGWRVGLMMRSNVVAAPVANPARQRRQVRPMRIDFRAGC